MIRMKEKILDLGCGFRKHPQTIGVDIDKERADVIFDLKNMPYPFKTNSIDGIYFFHAIEHLEAKPLKVMEELHRICKNKAMIHIKVPHVGSRTACDITHLSSMKEYRITSFEPFYDEKYHYTNRRLKLEKVELHYRMFDYNWWVRIINFLANKNINFCERIWRGWVGFFDEIYYELRVVK